MVGSLISRRKVRKESHHFIALRASCKYIQHGSADWDFQCFRMHFRRFVIIVIPHFEKFQRLLVKALKNTQEGKDWCSSGGSKNQTIFKYMHVHALKSLIHHSNSMFKGFFPVERMKRGNDEMQGKLDDSNDYGVYWRMHQPYAHVNNYFALLNKMNHALSSMRIHSFLSLCARICTFLTFNQHFPYYLW